MTDDADPANALYLQLKAASVKNQVQIVRDLGAAGEPGLDALMRFLAEYQQTVVAAPAVTSDATKASENTVLSLVGTIYQVLFSSGSAAATVFLQTHFPQGVVPLRASAEVDYAPLQQLLAEQNFQAAEQLTLQKLCEVVGAAAVQR
ncbi:MAG TPA: GUN4 N-terminal ARM-like repeat domain-containing protein, partial [Crinalium sp.]